RHHINAVKKGGEYFHILHQESLERKNTLNVQQAQGTRLRTDFQPCEYSSDTEELNEETKTCSQMEGSHQKKPGKKKKEMTLRSFIPTYNSVLIPRFSEAKSEHLFRQLCAIHWLLEASTLESNSSMHSILSCWNLTDPGGFKKSVKEVEEEKLATYMWELFVTNTKKYMRKARLSPLSRKTNKISAPVISQLSSQSSHGQTPLSSGNSLVLHSEDNVNMNGALSNTMSASAQTKEQPFLPSQQKLIQLTDREVSKDVHEQEDLLKKTGLQSLLSMAQNDYKVNMLFIKDQESIMDEGTNLFLKNIICGINTAKRVKCLACECQTVYYFSNFIKNKSNLCADTRQKFTAIREEAAYCLHDTLESLERSQIERCFQKYQALKKLKYFKKDMERIRQLGMRPEREHKEDGLKWFPVLLDRLSESAKNDHYVKKILQKLGKFGMNPDLKIHQDAFLKVLTDLQVWELCSPEIAAAVEFVRENIVQMPEEDFSEWFQARVALL
ncbi:CCD60 protein, partial [Alectura lathami]|nr:CCD60 protein [Alectura lathami]